MRDRLVLYNLSARALKPSQKRKGVPVAKKSTNKSLHGPAVKMGHAGGLRGGPARAKKLTAAQRKKIAASGGKASSRKHSISLQKLRLAVPPKSGAAAAKRKKKG